MDQPFIQPTRSDWSWPQSRLWMRPLCIGSKDPGLTSDNDSSSAPFGSLAPTPAQAAIITLAQRTKLKRGAFRPTLSRLVNLLRTGPLDVSYQGA